MSYETNLGLFFKGAGCAITRPLNLDVDEIALGIHFKDFQIKPLDIQLFKLEDVYLKYDQSGSRVYDSEGVLLDIYSDEIRPSNFLRESLGDGDRLSAEVVSDTYLAAVAFKAKGNYCHWLFEGLPKLTLLDEIEQESVSGLVVDECFCELSENVLARTRPNNTYKLMPISGKGVVYFKKLFITNSLKHPLHNGSPVIKAYYESLISIAPPASRELPKRFYIERPKGRRGVVNSNALIDLLSEFDIESVKLEDMTFWDQINLFKGASLIVGVHGAGFSNLVFCSKNTNIIEIFPNSYATPAFWYTSNFFGLNYYAHTDVSGWSETSHGSQKFEDVVIDIEKLKMTLSTLVC